MVVQKFITSHFQIVLLMATRRCGQSSISCKCIGVSSLFIPVSKLLCVRVLCQATCHVGFLLWHATMLWNRLDWFQQDKGDFHPQQPCVELNNTFFKHVSLRINFYLLRTFCPHLGSFLCCFFFHYVSAKFHLWPSSGDFTATLDRNAESCNRIPSNYYGKQ